MLQRRIERLEQRETGKDAVLVIIGEPNAAQQAQIEAGAAKVLVFIPDNGRGDYGRTTCAD